MYPNGSNVQLLVRERMGGVTAVDYHYRSTTVQSNMYRGAVLIHVRE